MTENQTEPAVSKVVGFAVLGLFAAAVVGMVNASRDVTVGGGICLIASVLALATILFGVLQQKR